jgi:spore germination protein
MPGVTRWLPVLAAGCLLAAPASGDSGRVQVAAWLPTTWDFENAWGSFSANAGRITCLSPVWYWMRADGGVDARLPGGAAGAAVGPVEAVVRAACRAAGVPLVPLVSNSGPGRTFDAAMAAAVLGNAATRAAHVRTLADLVVRRDYDGIEIDYELLRPEMREPFARFMGELAEVLHARGKLLAVAVHPKTAEPGGEWGAAAHDWAAIGAVVDSFRIMAYDYHWGNGPAGPVAPLPWFREVLAHALRTVPPRKVLMGIPTYGYDWTGSRTGRSRDVTAREAPRLAAAKGSGLFWDPVAHAPWFTYCEDDLDHVVWYEDARCLQPKVAAVREAGLGGIAVWRLGAEEPAFWEALDRALR